MKAQQVKAGDMVRITRRNTTLQPHVAIGNVYCVEHVETSLTKATVLVVKHPSRKGQTLRINSHRFCWDVITFEQVMAANKANSTSTTESQFREQVKTDVERILHAFTLEEHMQITFVPLVLNEIAWCFALKAMALAARDRVYDLKKLNRVLRQLREHYEKVVCKDLKASDLKRLQAQSMEFMQECSYHFQIMYYTASNVFSKQYGKLPFEEMRVYALLAMAIIRYTDQHNKRCDEMLRQRLGKIQAAKRMPAMDSLYTGMEAFTGELPEPYNFADTNLQTSMGVLRNNLRKQEWVVTPD